MKSIKHVTIIGLGAIGSFVAPRLYDVLGDEGFCVVASGARKARLERDGTVINGTTHYFPVVAPDEPCQPADLVIIAVKETALSGAMEDISGHVGPDTCIISLLNGVENEAAIIKRFGPGHELHAFVRGSVVRTDGGSTYNPQGGTIVFGEEKNTEPSERVLGVKDLFDRAGILCKVPEDMLHAQWFKFMANVGQNLVSALLGVPFGAYTVSDHANALRTMAMEEVAAVAAKKGIILGQAEMAEQQRIINNLPFHNRPSTQQDIEAGRKTEIETFAGSVIRMGQELGVPTPVNEVLYHAIRVLEEKNDGKFSKA